MAYAPPRFCLQLNMADFSAQGDAGVHAVGNLIIGCCGHVASDGFAQTGEREAAILAGSYRRHGPSLSAHVLGQYAAAILDPETRRVVLIQDSLGLRTLYYTARLGVLSIASDLPTLLSLTPEPELDENYFARYLAYGARPFGGTPYAGIKRLSLGRTVIVDQGSTRETFPWTPSDESSSLGKSEAADRLRELVDDAVASVLPVSGRVLCELSGGLDSSTVMTTAAKLRPGIVALTFTSSSGLASDDATYARDVVEQLGARWLTIDQDEYPMFSILPSIHEAEPGGEIRTALRGAYYRLLEREQTDVVLTGSGGDQAFGSIDIQPVHIADDLVAGRPLRAWHAASDWRDVGGSVRPEAFWFTHFGLRAAMRYARRRSLVFMKAERRPPWLRPQFLAAHRLQSVRPQIAHRVGVPSKQYLWETFYRLAENESSVVNHRFPCEQRHPLYYRPFVEFMVSLPASLRRGSEGERVLQRHALADRLPPTVIGRVTKGSNQALREQTFLHGSDWIRRLLDRPRTVQRGWVDEAAWRTAVERARFGVVPLGAQFDAAMCTEIWLQARSEAATSPPPQLRSLSRMVPDERPVTLVQ